MAYRTDVEHMERVVFLDRDGTLNREVHYLHKISDLLILPGVPEALKLLKDAGYKLVVVTNQAGVARGYYREEDVEALHAYMNRILAPMGGAIDAFYFCPHHPEHGKGIYKRKCRCRKPDTGMFEKAQEHFSVDKEHSFMIGDKLLDVEAGKNYGVVSILVGTGYGRDIHLKDKAEGNLPLYDYYAEDLLEAARWIMDNEKEDTK